MLRGSAPVNRFFARSQYSVSFRRLRRFHHQAAAISDYQVIALLSGKADYVTAEEKGQLSERESLLLNPAAACEIRAADSAWLSLTLAPALVLDFAARTHLVAASSTVMFSTIVTGRDDRLSQLANDISDELSLEDPGHEIVIEALLEQTLVHLLRRYCRLQHSSALELSRVGLIDRRIRRAVELMHAQLDQDLSLKELAAASFLSPYHFLRLFKKITGLTPHTYHANLRTNRARALLAESELSITQISAMVGYSSASHFTKAFRQSTGVTPRAYRAALVSR